MEKLLHELRAAGWMVACHNDYRQGDVRMTWWLFTHPSGLWIKGEGRTDLDALKQAKMSAGFIPVTKGGVR